MPQLDQPHQSYRFDDVVVDRNRFCVLKKGQPRTLEPRAFDLLIYLIEHRDRVVEKQELFDQIWKESFVTDDALAQEIKNIRHAIGDAAGTPRYIRTVRKRGYRFIASAEPPLIMPPRLAVLPFANLSPDPEQEFFGDAVTDGLITELGNVSTLRVISRQSVLHLKGTQRTIPEIACDLKVDLVVEGCVLVNRENIQITAQLILTTPEQHLWSKAYSCLIRDILTVEGQVARDVAEAAQVTLSAAEVGRLSRRRPVDPEAHVAYLKARLNLDKNSDDGFHQGLQCLHMALEKDPTHAPAYAQMALCYSLLGFWGHLPGPQAYPRAKRAALRAIALDDSLSLAHWALGWVSWLQDWDLATCKEETIRASDLNPSDEGAHVTYAVFLAIVGNDPAKAAAEAKLALDLDPLSLHVNTSAAWTYLFVEDYELARQQARTTLDMFPDALQGWYVLGWAELMHSRFELALEAFEKAVAISPDALSVGYLGHAHARAGHLDTATSLLQELLSRLEREHVPAKSLICMYAGLGERDQVVEWLEKAYQDRDPQLFFMGAVHIFGPLSGLIQTWTRERLPHLRASVTR